MAEILKDISDNSFGKTEPRRSWVEVEVVTSFVSHSRHIRDKFGKL